MYFIPLKPTVKDPIALLSITYRFAWFPMIFVLFYVVYIVYFNFSID